jgi:hypothetical protein
VPAQAAPIGTSVCARVGDQTLADLCAWSGGGAHSYRAICRVRTCFASGTFGTWCDGRWARTFDTWILHRGFGRSMWLEDPTGRHEYRFWNGAQWTHEVLDGGQASHDVLWRDDPRPAPTVMPSVPAKESGFAIASMVLGIASIPFGLFMIPQVLAVIFDHVALKQIEAAKGSRSGRDAARWGLILGYSMLVLYGFYLLLMGSYWSWW